ncbi:helix-turn-helix transcriptional regulator [Eggerthella sinensis]|uniref:helix-turn-helix transcriptional regulator n=1 Tax=Eggerthella sinensis TaxID=242230 RepID=UPI001D067306|nr:helix-turn-helix transcriptional regulator [Eggerthella sinensis]
MNTSKSFAMELAVAALFACFLSTSLFVRHDGADALVLTHYTSRIVEIASCFLIAFVARGSRINPFRLFQAGACSLVAYLALQGCERVLPPNLFAGQAVLLDSFAGVFNGILVASMVLLFARAFSALPSRHAIVLIPLSWACSHLIFLGSRLLPPSLVSPIELALLIFSSAGLYLVLRQLVPVPAFKGVVAPRKENLALVPLLKSSRYFSLYFGMLVFPFFYGLMAQICADAGVSSGLFDVATEVVGIAILALLAASAPLQRKGVDAEGSFVIILPVFATALLFLPLFWDREVFVSGFIMKCGFLIYTSLMWMQLQRLTSKAPDKSFFFFGIALGLYHLALMVGRLFAYALNAFTVLSDQTIASAALVAIWLLSMAALVMLLAHRRRKETPPASAPETSFDSAYALFAREHGLSERETLITREFSRGRTVAHIADELVVSQETVKTHLKRAYAKTGCHNRQDLIDLIEAVEHRSIGA